MKIGTKLRDGICAVLLCVFASIVLIGCVKDCEISKAKPEPKKIVIENPKPSNKGTVVIKEGENIVFSYEGIIHIVNNGRNGEGIDIQIQINDNTEEGDVK